MRGIDIDNEAGLIEALSKLPLSNCSHYLEAFTHLENLTKLEEFNA